MDTTNFYPFEGGPPSVRGSHTPNLVQIFKGPVTLYAFSPLQFTIRHTYRAKLSIRPNVMAPFHMLTTSGPRQLHTGFGPNIRPTFIQAGPLSFMFPRFTIQNSILRFDPRPTLYGPLNKINNRYETILSFWGLTTKCLRKPYTKCGPDIQRTCHAIRISPFQFTIRHTTAPCLIEPVSDQTW